MKRYTFITRGQILEELKRELRREGLIEQGEGFIVKKTFATIKLQGYIIPPPFSFNSCVLFGMTTNT